MILSPEVLYFFQDTNIYLSHTHIFSEGKYRSDTSVVDSQGCVAFLLLPPKIHNQLLGFADVQ